MTDDQTDRQRILTTLQASANPRHRQIAYLLATGGDNRWSAFDATLFGASMRLGLAVGDTLNSIRSAFGLPTVSQMSGAAGADRRDNPVQNQ